LKASPQRPGFEPHLAPTLLERDELHQIALGGVELGNSARARLIDLIGIGRLCLGDRGLSSNGTENLHKQSCHC
jgi:hypothetical protein